MTDSFQARQSADTTTAASLCALLQVQGDATGGWVVKRLPPPPGGLTRFSVYLRDRDDLPEQPPIPDGPPYSDAVRISSRDDKQQPDETGKQPSQGGEGTVSQPARAAYRRGSRMGEGWMTPGLSE